MKAVFLASRSHCSTDKALEQQPEHKPSNSAGTSHYCVLITQILWGLLCYRVKSNNDWKGQVNLSVSSSCLQRNNLITFVFSFLSQLFVILFTLFSLSSLKVTVFTDYLVYDLLPVQEFISFLNKFWRTINVIRIAKHVLLSSYSIDWCHREASICSCWSRSKCLLCVCVCPQETVLAAGSWACQRSDSRHGQTHVLPVFMGRSWARLPPHTSLVDNTHLQDSDIRLSLDHFQLWDKPGNDSFPQRE